MKLDEALTAPLCGEVLKFTDDIVYHIDTRAHTVYINDAGYTRLEVPVGAAHSKPWIAFVHEDDRPHMSAAIDRVIITGEDVSEVDARLVSLHGRVTHYNHRLRALKDAKGTATGVLGIARDVTEHKRILDQLHQSQKLETIGMLAGGIAHDFNNMLAAILGYTELMLEEKSEQDTEYRALSYIHSSTERAAALVKQLLVYSRKSTAELKPVRVGALIDETLQMLERTLPKTIRIMAYVDEEQDRVMGDAGRLQQAIMNLCLNARDAMPNGGELRIEVGRLSVEKPVEMPRAQMRPGDYVRIRIQDTGQGMAPDVLAHIWDPFFTTKPAGEGTGLGLAVVQGIMQTHHGHVQVESQVGRGTSFYLYLPAASEPQIDEVQTRVEPPGGNETILIVDDEPILLDLLFDILHSKGYHVLAANTVGDAIDFIEAVGDRIDLVISDNMMPGMTGRGLTQEILARRPEMKIMVCSGFSPTRESEMTNMDYVTSYVQKPYQRRDLLTKVRQALDEPAPGQPRASN
jgi:two-component system, cell cycle sensor histidine kinase and response regulator CckA